MSNAILGIDIGASNIRVCIAKEELLLKKKEPADFSNFPSSLIKKIKRMIGKEMSFRSAGVAVAGFISRPKGMIIRMPNAGVEQFKIAELIKSEFRIKDSVLVVNDAVAAAYAEWRLNGSKEDMLYLTFSTGIGGAAVLAGEVISGREGNSHEVGHIVVDKDRRMVCGCGRKGHWEAYCSGRGLVSYFSSYFSKVLDRISAKMIFDRAREKEKVYSDFLAEVIRLNSIGIASVLNIYNPDMLVIGGSVALKNWNNYLIPSIKSARDMMIFPLPKIRKAKLGDYSSAYGAALMAKEGMR